MAYQYIGKDIYKQLEQTMNKLDEALSLIKELNNTINDLNKTIKEKDRKIEKLIEENERLKNKNDKNSTNSSKPSSTNYRTPKKKTGANLYNYRIKSNKNIGAQFGHKGKYLSKQRIDELIQNKKVEVKEYVHYIDSKKKEDIIKYRIGIKIKAYVEKHIFKNKEETTEKLPKEFYTDVIYDNSIKSLSIELGSYNVISYDRLSDFFNVITDGALNISNGTLVNFVKEFSDKSEKTLENLELNLLNQSTIYTDETGTKFNKRNIFVRNYSNSDTVLYKAHLHKGHNPIKEDGILTNFYGGIMGDHDTTLYSYGTKNYECNIHLGRYLEELIQNVHDVEWPNKMKNLIFKMNNSRKIAILFGSNYFDKNKIKEYESEYDEILKLSKEENKKIKSSFYKEKANKLSKRMKKYKKNHLYFIRDFNVPFDDNLSEQDLRIFKIKTKISGGFRSFEVAKNYVNILSIIKTSIKRNINPFESIKRIFNNEILFA